MGDEETSHSLKIPNMNEFSHTRYVLHNQSQSIYYYYDFGEKLGQGSYGVVCKGIEKETGAMRAIKIISKSHIKNLLRFRTEIAIMKRLDHPNIIKLYETFEDDKNLYLVLELCMGGELFDKIIQVQSFPEIQAARIIYQIVSAIQYCHLNGIVHRDLKPENFLFLSKDDNSSVKIIDFGLASHWSDTDPPMKTKAGTPYYVAPQVLRGHYGSECDMWSVGVILYILLCGYPPFTGNSDMEILQKVKACQYEFPQEDWDAISNDAKELIQRLLEVEPEKRLTPREVLENKWITEMLAQYCHTNGNMYDLQAVCSLHPSGIYALCPLQKFINFNGYFSLSQKIEQEIESRLQQFLERSFLRKIALFIYSITCSEAEIELIKCLYYFFDVNQNGHIDQDDIKTLCERRAVEMGDMRRGLERLLTESGEGKISFSLFAASLLCVEANNWNSCKQVFRVLDRDGDGKITAEDLCEILGVDKERSGEIVEEGVREIEWRRRCLGISGVSGRGREGSDCSQSDTASHGQQKAIPSSFLSKFLEMENEKNAVSIIRSEDNDAFGAASKNLMSSFPQSLDSHSKQLGSFLASQLPPLFTFPASTKQQEKVSPNPPLTTRSEIQYSPSTNFSDVNIEGEDFLYNFPPVSQSLHISLIKSGKNFSLEKPTHRISDATYMSTMYPRKSGKGPWSDFFDGTDSSSGSVSPILPPFGSSTSSQNHAISQMVFDFTPPISPTSPNSPTYILNSITSPVNMNSSLTVTSNGVNDSINPVTHLPESTSPITPAAASSPIYPLGATRGRAFSSCSLSNSLNQSSYNKKHSSHTSNYRQCLANSIESPILSIEYDDFRLLLCK